MRLHDEPGAFVWPAARGRSFDYCRYPEYCDGLVPDRNFQLCRSWRTEFRSQRHSESQWQLKQPEIQERCRSLAP
jgi:hypothetical protein